MTFFLYFIQYFLFSIQSKQKLDIYKKNITSFYLFFCLVDYCLSAMEFLVTKLRSCGFFMFSSSAKQYLHSTTTKEGCYCHHYDSSSSSSSSYQYPATIVIVGQSQAYLEMSCPLLGNFVQ